MAQYVVDTPYTREEKIAIALDIGTTHSAVSFSHLYPGEKPTIRLVTKWPGQPEATGDSKVPTLIVYRNGTPVAYGAEALEFVDDEDHEVAQWFKLHLHPDSMKISDLPPPYESGSDLSPSIEIPELPRNITLTQVYSDLLKYVHGCTRDFFEKSTANGPQIWTRLHTNASFVFCIPNGWDIAQQALLRKAAITAGLFSEKDADLRLEFVTEGEASVHYALAYTNSTQWLQKGTVFAVMDAGGSTVDSTLYTCKETAPQLILEEVCSSECVQAGGVFVDRAARSMLEMKLQNSSFNDASLIQLMTKRIFDGTQHSNVIHFGRSTDNDRPNGILKGRLSLTSEEVALTFNNVLERIGHSSSKLLSERLAHHLLLVGGFGESPLLRNFLRDHLKQQGTEVIVIDESSKKAAAEGAMQWYIKRLVTARAMRCTVGVPVLVDFNSLIPEHKARSQHKWIGPDGVMVIDGGFSICLTKDAVVKEDMKQKMSYVKHYEYIPQDLGDFQVLIFVWNGQKSTEWYLDQQGDTIKGIRTLCYLKANLSGLSAALLPQKGKKGRTFWGVDYSVVIYFGGTQLRAAIEWEEEGILRQGPITILPGTVY